ncbi:uncharacterized protein LOC128553380 [Mercenaria mercenaria]|uniref:uncharacterized protein LOC128553380 n=1 Tax=Mercenaria mercenaria TaxID=6596 RepID=UPI00234F4A26|nr:uncharacterized protein LOC128553380 [Mercenaria mercenaria]
MTFLKSMTPAIVHCEASCNDCKTWKIEKRFSMLTGEDNKNPPLSPPHSQCMARESPGHIIYTTYVDFKTSLQDRIPKGKDITIDFEPASRCVGDVNCHHTLTNDNVNILMNHAVHSENTQIFELRNLSFGQKAVSCTFSTSDCLFIRNSLADRYTPKLAYLTLLESYLKNLNFDKSDVEVEHNVYARSIILDYICYSLVKSREDVVEAYPSTKEKNTFVLIAFTKNDNDYQELETFNGLQVLCRPYLTKSSESILAENYAQEQGLHCSFGKDIQLLNEVIESKTGALFTDHSNIEGIGLSMVRSTSKGFDTSSPCVVLYCKCKSYIPFGEQEFPKYLIHQSGLSFKTDVREGRFSLGPNGNTLLGAARDWHKELAMGCSVGPKSGHYDATIGPFVKVEGIDQTCFLTVRHMFQPFDLDDRRLQGTKLMQPADGDTKSDPYSQAGHGGPVNDRECGDVLTSIFSERVDAAVVKIKADRSPSRGYFVVPTENELKVAGFSRTNFPTFDDGSIMNAAEFTTEDVATERVVKFGKTTGLTKGSLELNSMVVKVVDEEALAIQYNGRLESKVMKNQLKINSHSLKTFFQLGDSGSAVFLVDKRNKLHCIGMAIGSMSDLSCLVTPIQVVLSELEKKLGKKILLKNFEMENMQ